MTTVNQTNKHAITKEIARAKYQNPNQEVIEVTLDASGKRLGRLATQIAVLLQGKERADYAPNLSGNTIVTVENADKLEISEAKKATKTYQSFSGYPGGLKTETMQTVITKKGNAEVLRSAVRGMLPKNKLQSIRMHNLIIPQTGSDQPAANEK